MDEFQPTVPPASDAVRAEAAGLRDAWVYAIDPHFDPNGKVPPYGVVGAWKVDSHGNITNEFRHNPKYRPSPRARGMKEPTDPLDSVIQLAATGYASDLDVQSVLLDSTVYVVPGCSRTPELPLQDGDRAVVEIYTSPMHAPNSVPEVQRMTLRGILRELPESAILKLNPHSTVSAEVLLADIRRAAEQ